MSQLQDNRVLRILGNRRSAAYAVLAIVSLVLGSLALSSSVAAQWPTIRNPAGLQMTVDAQDTNPALSVTVPDGPVGQRSFQILFPEHVTVRVHGEKEARHLYIFRSGRQGLAPKWKKTGNTLEYEQNLGAIHFLARATLVDDGILFRYEFVNHSATDYDMITAITDPRFHAVFYDPRLERTYVHRQTGFELLGSDTPERLSMPLKDWFPVRYLASYTAPVPTDLVHRPGAGITYRYKSQSVDLPLIATVSTDGTWIAASFSRDPGNVWSNPELTCQHVDPEAPLPHYGRAEYEVKILIFKGGLQDVLRKLQEQRKAL